MATRYIPIDIASARDAYEAAYQAYVTAFKNRERRVKGATQAVRDTVVVLNQAERDYMVAQQADEDQFTREGLIVVDHSALTETMAQVVGTISVSFPDAPYPLWADR